ncbi:hypothetical protein [Rubritepida flocculans]|uniref:hypothetical protein n=1 Tax=Rubritepida flocculans TaxID=182403 RepID=UPI0004095CF0|nr:hypothetical protein [Rubritepida flocculans]
MIRPALLLAPLLLAAPALAHHGGPHPPGNLFAQADSIQELQRQRARPDTPPGVQAQRRDAEAADALGEEPARRLLLNAREAVQARRFGQANELLERAEARLLTRSTAPARAGEPLRGGPIGHLAAAREALLRRDAAAALREIDAALAFFPGPRAGRPR